MATCYCPFCGGQVSDTVKFCPHCGGELPPPSVVHPLTADPTPTAPPVGGGNPTPPSMAKAPKTKRPSSRSRIWIPVLLVAAILIAVIAIPRLSRKALTTEEIFAHIHKLQTREDIMESFGVPDTVFNEDMCCFNDLSFLGKEGSVSLIYTHGYVDKLSFLGEFKDKYDYKDYADEVLEFFEDRYGSPEEDYGYLYWEIDDHYHLVLQDTDLFMSEDQRIIVFYIFRRS